MAALNCTNCGNALAALRLAGHYGREVELDLCAGCHLVWFDPVEPARLSGTGLLALVGEMARAQTLPHQAAGPQLACPHCRGALRTVHNRTRWGPSLQLECNAGHGCWQSFGQFLTEKGLLRAMGSADRARALQRDGSLHCVNCGGAIGAQDAQCSWCGSVPALVDVARLARALDPESATAGHAVHGTAAQRGALQCAACGAAQPPDGGWQCVACQATLTATGLAEAHRLVAALEPALQAHALKPAPHVVQRRLAAMQPALDRQRERAQQMQAEADAALGRTTGEERRPWGRVPDGSGGSTLEQLLALWRWLNAPRHTGWLLGGALLLLWWWLG